MEKRTKRKSITIGMAHHNDFNGAYFSIQDIIKELKFNNKLELLDKIHFVVVENDRNSEHAAALRRFQNATGLGEKFKIITLENNFGTSCTRNAIIEEADTDYVLVMDCHVLLCPAVGVIEGLFDLISKYPNTKNLYQGPLLYDNLISTSTHFNDVWEGEMWGQWAQSWRCSCDNHNISVVKSQDEKCLFVDLVTQRRIEQCPYCWSWFPMDLSYYGHDQVLNKSGMKKLIDCNLEQFEIFSQGLGVFFINKRHWLKFNEHCKGFGGEECYIHTKYRHHGRKVMCLPFLKWLHRFERPDGVKYELTMENKVRNYVLELTELGLDKTAMEKHFLEEVGFSRDIYNSFVEEANEIYKREQNG